MKQTFDFVSQMSFATKARLGVCVILYTLLAYCLTVYLCFRHHPFFITPERINLWAFQLSLCSVLSLAIVAWFILTLVPTGPAPPGNEESSFLPSRRIHTLGLMLGLLGVAICLPATFRAVEHPREVMIFWHDEGITLELVQAFVVGEKEVPDYRFTQGWVTFLPVALVLKALNCFVPVHFTLTNIALRGYQLTTLFLIIYFTYRLIWQITRSWWMAAAVVLIAYTRSEFFHISLAIDRPDTFQLLFVLLALIHAHRFWMGGQPRAWFLAVFFAAFAFASKYSGHLLTPVLLLPWIAHWRRPEVLSAYPTSWKYWTSGIAGFALSVGLIFPFTFFILSLYHLIKLPEVIHFFRSHLAIYKTGNVFSLPDYQAPSHALIWWETFTSRYAFDYWLTILGLAGAAACLIKNTIGRSKQPRALGEWLLLSWGVCYISFLVYQYGLVDYRYIMPVQYVLPFFFLLPLFWLQQSTAIARVPYRTVLGFGAVALVFLLCGSRLHQTLSFLGTFRSEASVQACYDVGRYLDRTTAADENPKILVTNLAYIPPRFTNLHIHNVDVTSKFIDKHHFDFVIVTENMYSVYANKPTAGCAKQYDPLYKVHYVDVVEAYTKFKNHAHPDYRYVTSFGDYFHVFERVDRPARVSRVSSIK
jgi:Dolichyl-phosphate-mannose-protein mannosyltransferase